MNFGFLNGFIKHFKNKQKVFLDEKNLLSQNLPSSIKRLNQQYHLESFTQKYKIMQYVNSLDHNHQKKRQHFNQIIEEVYYPNVNLKSESNIKAKENQITDKKLFSKAQISNIIIKDHLACQIGETMLPLELFQIHELNKSQFNHLHFQLLLKSIKYYCQHFQTIKNPKMKAWNTLKRRQRYAVYRFSKNPELFLTKEEIVRHKYWISFIQNLVSNIEKQPKIDQVNKYLKVVVDIAMVFNQLPSQLYELVLQRNMSCDYKLLSKFDISELLRLLKQQKKLRYVKNIVICQTGRTENQISDLFKYLAESVLNNFKDYSIHQFINIFKLINLKMSRIELLSQQNIQISIDIISKFMHQFSFEDIYIYFTVYSALNIHLDIQFLQILKLDLYRKAQNCVNAYYIVMLIGKIKENKLIIKNFYNPAQNPPIKLDATDLTRKLEQSVTKFIGQSILNLRQITTIIDFCYSNDTTNLLLVELISSELIKRQNQFSLENLAKNCFKIILLGHRSNVLVKFVYQKFIQHYQSFKNKYTKEEKYIAPNQHQDSQLQTDSQLNFNMIYLQESLILSIWSLISNFDNKQNQLEKEVNLEQLFKFLPVKIESMDPLIYQLVYYINHTLERYDMFSKMQCTKYDPLKYPLGRFNQFYRPNSFKGYIQKEMDYEISLLDSFVKTYNQKEDKFKKQKWSKLNYYIEEDYVQWILANPRTNTSFFDKNKLLTDEQLFMRRQRTAKLVLKNKVGNIVGKKIDENKKLISDDLF